MPIHKVPDMNWPDKSPFPKVEMTKIFGPADDGYRIKRGRADYNRKLLSNISAGKGAGREAQKLAAQN